MHKYKYVHENRPEMAHVIPFLKSTRYQVVTGKLLKFSHLNYCVRGISDFIYFQLWRKRSIFGFWRLLYHYEGLYHLASLMKSKNNCCILVHFWQNSLSRKCLCFWRLCTLCILWCNSQIRYKLFIQHIVHFHFSIAVQELSQDRKL